MRGLQTGFLNRLALAVLIAGVSTGRVDADEPQNSQRTLPSPTGQPVIETDSVNGTSRLYLLQPNGEKILLRTLPPRGTRPAETVPPEVTDYLNALQAIPDGERYIIGVELQPIPRGLHARLGIEEDRGLIVANLLSEQPAAQAGVQQYDILLKINGKPVSQPGDVVRAVNESGDKPVTLTLLRDKAPFELKVTPVVAPPTAPAQSGGSFPDANQVLPEGMLPPGVQIVGPGMIVPASPPGQIQALQKEVEELKKQLDELIEHVERLEQAAGTAK